MLKSIKTMSGDDALVLALVAAAFFPWAASFALLAIIAAALLIIRRTRELILADRNAVKWLAPFVPIAMIPPAVHGNWLGVACGVGVILFFALFLYLRRALTPRRIDTAFNLICGLSIFAAVYAVIEKLVYIKHPALAEGSIVLPSNDELRCASLFGNPNEYSSVIVIAVLIAAHMFLEKKGNRWFYALCIGFNLVGMLLCASLMGILELYFGLFALLVLRKEWKWVAAYSALTVVGGAALWLLPKILPHLSVAGNSFDLRVRIWKLAVIMLKEAALFGRGILSYWRFSPDYVGQDLGFKVRVTTNAHNLLLDGLLSFGIIGMALLVVYLVKLLRPALRRYRDGSGRALSAVAFAAIIGALVHGVCDVTILWPQVTVLFFLVFAASVYVRPTGKEKISSQQDLRL